MTVPTFLTLPDGFRRFHIAAAAAAVLGVAVAGALWHPWVRAAETPIVYICTETNETFLTPPQPVPAINPKTGRQTLVRGIYCAECGRWYAMPPPIHRSGNPKALYCHIHHVPMTFDGPVDTRPASSSVP